MCCKIVMGVWAFLCLEGHHTSLPDCCVLLENEINKKDRLVWDLVVNINYDSQQTGKLVLRTRDLGFTIFLRRPHMRSKF